MINANSSLVVISMSGGLDSTTLAYKALHDGLKILPINFIYGQRHVVEIVCYREIINKLIQDFSERVVPPVTIDLRLLNHKALEIYQNLRDNKTIKDKSELEFYVPSRNLLFGVVAAQLAEIISLANDSDEALIGLGVHKHETYKNYWDITPEFVQKFQELLQLNNVINLGLYTPYVNKTKKDIIEDAIKLGVPYKNTWTCYTPALNKSIQGLYEYTPCGTCEACIERKRHGEIANVDDINDYKIEITEEELKSIH